MECFGVNCRCFSWGTQHPTWSAAVFAGWYLYGRSGIASFLLLTIVKLAFSPSIVKRVPFSPILTESHSIITPTLKLPKGLRWSYIQMCKLYLLSGSILGLGGCCSWTLRLPVPRLHWWEASQTYRLCVTLRRVNGSWLWCHFYHCRSASCISYHTAWQRTCLDVLCLLFCCSSVLLCTLASICFWDY